MESELTLWLKAMKNQLAVGNHSTTYWTCTEGGSFYRITAHDSYSHRAFAFVAKKDGYSKAMGHYKKGDIFKPASYKAPAKHARGNILDETTAPLHNIKSVYGPDYLTNRM